MNITLSADEASEARIALRGRMAQLSASITYGGLMFEIAAGRIPGDLSPGEASEWLARSALYLRQAEHALRVLSGESRTPPAPRLTPYLGLRASQIPAATPHAAGAAGAPPVSPSGRRPPQTDPEGAERQ